MPALRKDVDPQGLLEYSVVYTDRALNHMSQSFQGVMNDISSMLKEAYNAEAAVVVPGSGTFGMEAAARQFATGKKCLVVRNGWFSFRWTQIFDMGNIPTSHSVHKARPVESGKHPAYAPAPIDEVVAAIQSEKPDVVCAPHIETSAGMMLPDDYIRALADAVHEHGGLMMLDCIASGTLWVDMAATGVDVLISAPQKGWSGSPCAGLVMLSAHGETVLQETTSTSFSCDLKKWREIMAAYENGGHAYHATMPTDGLRAFAEVMRETREMGFANARAAQEELGRRVRELLEGQGIKSLAATGFKAPSVVVSYTDDPEMQTGKKFAQLGMQIAAGVPLQCDEAEDFRTFRIGLFGLDKLKDIDRTVSLFARTLEQIAIDDAA
ncbi:MAG: alanine--glyoxylate aminotransferase family protein [Proteobacteria bacterium TMED51]|jgi:aspartate aminotransferase-like enzyme|nr:MAG: aminotransferase [Candidatus Endolissoclinum sp. TMED55]RPG01980.1 MAG: alanine--glyoxylate aminotransferase family protein [Proteobacteria bacterium TMED51]HBP83533.1 aminotransferase [Gammaproteobacteria bacterium]|tara:strand:+ start:3293 stop:4435 length:1143 start_codon:yes stop_codon:yes gene_type:complete